MDNMFQNNNPYMMLPGISPEEMGYIQQALAQLTEGQQKYFYMNYTTKRKSPQDIMIFCIVGLCLVPGLQRFVRCNVLCLWRDKIHAAISQPMRSPAANAWRSRIRRSEIADHRCRRVAVDDAASVS